MKGRLTVLEKLNKYEFAVEVRIMRTGVNRNNWNYQNLDKYYDTFVGQPILCAYTLLGTRIADGHNMKEKYDVKTGEMYYSFMDADAERIVGTLSDNVEDFQLVEEDGETWLIAKGKLFAFYAKELVDKIVEVGTMATSAETEVFDSYMDGDIEVFTKWSGLGLTILHETVPEAIPGSRVKQLAALKTEFNSVKLRAASLIAGNEIDDEDDEVADEDEPDDVDETEDVEDTDEEDVEDETDEGEIKDDSSLDTNTERGMAKLKSLTKMQIAELSARFEGYKVLGAAENDAHNIFVALMSNDGKHTATYRMDSLEDTIVPEKIVKVNAKVAFNFDGEEEDLCVDACDMTADLSEDLDKSNCNLEAAQTALNAANSRIESMQNAENARRVKEAKSVATNTLSAFNENRTDKIEAKNIDAIMTDIESGIYTNSVDANGEWVGAESVKNAVLAVCGAKVMEMDKANMAKNHMQYVWAANESNHVSDDGTLAGMLSELGL